MAKKKVRVLNATVGGKKQGDVLDVEEKTAEMLVANRYVEYVKAEPKSDDSGDKAPAGDKKPEGDEKPAGDAAKK